VDGDQDCADSHDVADVRVEVGHGAVGEEWQSTWKSVCPTLDGTVADLHADVATS